METKPMNIAAKHPLIIRVGDHKVDFHSGCSIIDVTFPNTFYVEIQEIHFKNYYSASVSVLVKQKDSDGGDPRWKVAVQNLQLMSNPHSEHGGEDYFSIPQKQMLLPLHNILGVRFVLRQPSPVWREFKIDDIKIYKTPFQITPEVNLPSWLSDSGSMELNEEYDHQLKNHGVTSVSTICQDLQSLWALAEQTGTNQTQSSLGRYDVEGSYEINLLSYT